jgi:hypothetical protein
MARNKIVYGSEVLIDLTADTVTKEKLLKGATAHDKSGEVITGTCEYDVNSQDATVAEAEMLEGKTGYARGTKLTGSMPNKGAVTLEISEKAQEVTVPLGFHDGAGKAKIAATELAKLIPANIREGVTVLGVEGSMSGSEGMAPQAKSVTPSKTQQVVLPDDGYNCLSQVTVAAIPYTETENSAGGMTVTIAGV